MPSSRQELTSVSMKIIATATGGELSGVQVDRQTIQYFKSTGNLNLMDLATERETADRTRSDVT